MQKLLTLYGLSEEEAADATDRCLKMEALLAAGYSLPSDDEEEDSEEQQDSEEQEEESAEEQEDTEDSEEEEEDEAEEEAPEV